MNMRRSTRPSDKRFMPKKSLGQHFLIDRTVVRRIVEAIGQPPVIVEVGPGPGVLTGPLAAGNGRLICVELDDALAARLQEHFASTPNVTVVHGDVLASPAEALLQAGGVTPGTPYVVAGNLPYNIGAAILRHFLEAVHPPERMVVMLQKEVAASICAAPGDMGLLGVATQVYAEPRRLFDVPPGAFAPPPKVTSSVIELTGRQTPIVSPQERDAFFTTVRAGFSAPRKQLRNTLAQGLRIEASVAEAALASAGIEASLRPAMLSVDDWCRRLAASFSRRIDANARRAEDTGMTLELLAPAKLNLTLEILGKHEDGYHEVISLMQAIDLGDIVTLQPAGELRLVAEGAGVGSLPDEQANLAYRAAVALRNTASQPDLGATIRLQKDVPSGGLGGGSSDAAAVLRGLNQLWDLGLSEEELSPIAASIGSDVTFFLHGGTALATGRGEIIEPLPDMPSQELTLFLSDETISDKTKRMYAQITPADYSDAGLTTQAVEKLRTGEPLTWWDVGNVFDRHLKMLAPKGAGAMRLCTQGGVGVIATGAGPAFFSLMSLSEIPRTLLDRLESEFGVTARAVRTLTRAESLVVREV
jgi:ribosomal RNA small subunit methyltransferase A/4-diphosphocytidyl-2C-methyl-D-erythritol kinase